MKSRRLTPTAALLDQNLAYLTQIKRLEGERDQLRRELNAERTLRETLEWQRNLAFNVLKGPQK